MAVAAAMVVGTVVAMVGTMAACRTAMGLVVDDIFIITVSQIKRSVVLLFSIPHYIRSGEEPNSIRIGMRL